MSSTGVEGRVALVTGASSGIGEATAEALASCAAKVVVTARRREKLDALVSRIASAGREAFALSADLSTPEGAAQIVKDAEARHGRLDILVNNAGVMYLEPTAEADLGRWRHMLELNVLGLIAASQAALPGMRARRDGHIVNIASSAGRVANPNSAGYSATKFGVVGYAEALPKELDKDRVRVTVVEPGVVETELRDHVAHADARKGIDQFAASLRQLKSEDVANAILFAVSQPEHVCINEILMRPTDQER